LRPINHRIPLYCLDFVSGDIKSAPARKAPERPERIGRTPGISSAVAVVAAVPDCGLALAGGTLAVSSGVIGVAAPEVPGGGLLGGDPGLPGVVLGAVEELGGVLLAGAAVPDEFDGEAPPELLEAGAADEAPDCDPPPRLLGSALRMIGRPSLPEPMTTTLALGDCESKRVASMPRQRR
jgi:hypothetical protein